MSEIVSDPKDLSDDPPAKAVADPESYREALDVWMKRQCPELEGLRVHDVDMPRATGFSNETIIFSASGHEAGAPTTRRFVARIEPPDGGLFPPQTPACRVSCDVQHRIMTAVAASGAAPVPPLLPYEADPSVLGRPFFAMEFVEGVVPADVPRYSQAGFLVESASPAQRRQLMRDGVSKMAALARVDWREAGLDWLDISGTGQPAFSDQLDLYRAAVTKSLGGRDHPVLLRSLDWLETYAPDVPVGLSWGDARIGNMIWRDYECQAVVDWEACALAPPQADIGWWLMFDRQSFDDMEAPRLEGFPTRQEMRVQWEDESGLSAGDVHYWEIFALMRFAAIMIGLGDRLVAHGLMPAPGMAIDNHVTAAILRRLDAD